MEVLNKVPEELKGMDYDTARALLDFVEAEEAIASEGTTAKTRAARALGVRIFGTAKGEPVDIDKLTAGMTRTEIIAKMAVDFNFFSKFMLPQVMKYSWPMLMCAIWNLLADCVADLQDEAGEANLALAIPRGFAKTTFMKLYIVYCILFTRHTFILIVCSVDSNAENILKDVTSMLDSSQVRSLFGHWDAEKSNDRQDFKHFKFMGKDIILRAKGANTSLRGVNVGHRRPDIILMDDMQTEENAKSTVESENLKSWMMSTLLPTVSPEGGINLFIGNSYSYAGAILPMLVKSPEWLTLTLGCILADGTSLWPELHPVEKLLAHYRRDVNMGVEAIWLAQYMNAMDVNRGNLIDLARVGSMFAGRWPDCANDEDICSSSSQAKFIIIDPATAKENADDTGVGLFYVMDGVPVLRRVDSKVYTPRQVIVRALAHAVRESVPIVFVEDVAYQDTLIFWAEYYTKVLKLADVVQWRPISPKRTSKNARILIMFEQCMKGELFIHPDAWPLFKAEATHFDKMKTNNKDNVLDVAHYGPIVTTAHLRELENLYHDVFYKALAEKSKSNRRLANPEKLPC